MKSRPQLSFLCALAFALLFVSCHSDEPRDVLRMGIARNLTHLAVGQSARLTAFEEYRVRSKERSTASAASVRDILRAPLSAARWSVSDTSVVSISDDGTLTALKPGRAVVKSSWQNFEATTTVEVLKSLPAGRLPQLYTHGSECLPQSVSLQLEKDRTLHFHLDFERRSEAACADISLSGRAPEGHLPWEIPFDGGTLTLKSARGSIVNGVARLGGAGEVWFTVWTDGEGGYPVSLQNKTVLLVGDSMAEGVAQWLQKKVEEAGGRFIDGHERSSTIIWWQEGGHFSESLALNQPDIVFIALGSNELFLQQPEARAPLIKKMVEELGAREAYWIGPPSWKPDTGLVHVIDDNFQPGHFYNSNDLKVPRQPDGKHPTVEGYKVWTELVWDWYAHAV